MHSIHIDKSVHSIAQFVYLLVKCPIGIQWFVSLIHKV